MCKTFPLAGPFRSIQIIPKSPVIKAVKHALGY